MVGPIVEFLWPPCGGGATKGVTEALSAGLSAMVWLLICDIWPAVAVPCERKIGLLRRRIALDLVCHGLLHAVGIAVG